MRKLFSFLTVLFVITVSSLTVVSCGKNELVNLLKTDQSYVAIVKDKDSDAAKNFELIVNQSVYRNLIEQGFKKTIDQFNLELNNKAKVYYYKNLVNCSIQQLREQYSGLNQKIDKIEFKTFDVKGKVTNNKLYKEANKYLQNDFNKKFVEFYKQIENPNNSKNIPGKDDKKRKELIEKWINDKFKDVNDVIFIFVRNGQVINFKSGFSLKNQIQEQDFIQWFDEILNQFKLTQIQQDKYKWDNIYLELLNKFKHQ